MGMLLVLLLSTVAVGFWVYQMIMPVKQVKQRRSSVENLDIGEALLDVRGFIDANHNQVDGAINIPLAYLKRHHRELKDKKIHVIGANRREINSAIRLLKRKNVHVLGYSLAKNEGRRFDGVYKPNEKQNQAC